MTTSYLVIFTLYYKFLFCLTNTYFVFCLTITYIRQLPHTMYFWEFSLP